jgi:hypothetical protein
MRHKSCHENQYCLKKNQNYTTPKMGPTKNTHIVLEERKIQVVVSSSN